MITIESPAGESNPLRFSPSVRALWPGYPHGPPTAENK